MIYCTFDYIDIYGGICKRSLINYNTPDTIGECRNFLNRFLRSFEGRLKGEIWEDGTVVETVYPTSKA